MAQQLQEQPGPEEGLNDCFFAGVWNERLLRWGRRDVWGCPVSILCFGRKSNQLTAKWASKGCPGTHSIRRNVWPLGRRKLALMWSGLQSRVGPTGLRDKQGKEEEWTELEAVEWVQLVSPFHHLMLCDRMQSTQLLWATVSPYIYSTFTNICLLKLHQQFTEHPFYVPDTWKL